MSDLGTSVLLNVFSGMKNFSERWENAVLENQYAEKNKQKYEDTVRNFFTLISHHHMSQW